MTRRTTPRSTSSTEWTKYRGSTARSGNFSTSSSGSNYVGYTATPFANIFIDPDSEDQMAGHDLFPRDFIVSLDPPTNYFGAARVFRDSADTVLRDVDDHEDLMPTSHKPSITS